jgi:hypothetical protein
VYQDLNIDYDHLHQLLDEDDKARQDLQRFNHVFIDLEEQFLNKPMLLDLLLIDVSSSAFPMHLWPLVHFLATNEQHSSNFKNKTKGFGSRSLCQIGYTGGGINEHG